MYEEELRFLKEHEDPGEVTNKHRERLSAQEIAALRAKLPGIPEDYLTYLMEVGHGTFRECQFGVWPHGEFLESALSGYEGDELERYVAFGHNFAGDTSVFDSKANYRVMEYWHSSRDFFDTGKTFREYIRACMLIGVDGEDQREK